MATPSSSLDDELGVPKDATLRPQGIHGTLQSNGGNRIPIAHESCANSDDHDTTSRRSLIVGRQAASVDLRIQHKSISRKHAVLYYLSSSNGAISRLILVDLGGKHGTLVNGQPVTAHEPHGLKDGDVLQFGNVRDETYRVEMKQVNAGEGTEEPQPEVTAAERDQTRIEQAGAGLSGRAKRQAEIAAMMDSLEQAPVYQKVATAETYNSQESSSMTDENQRELKRLAKLAKRFKLPITKRLALESTASSHRKNAVTCLAIDPAGARFVVGSTDTQLRFYDFGGMLRDRTDSFKNVIPDDGYLIVQCAYSSSGDRVLVGTSSVQPRVLERDGDEVIKFVRGDMYVTDQSKTVGHTATVTSVDWHPLDRDLMLTSSDDGSARIWNLQGKTQFQMLVCDKVFQAKSARGQRTAVKTVCFHPGGREFALGTACGSIQIWNRTRVSSRPERVVYDAHEDDSHRGSVEPKPITYLVYSTDGDKLASRSSEDDTVLVWDPKRLSKSSRPLNSCSGLGTIHESSNVCFSPDGRILCAGSSNMIQGRRCRRIETGALHFFDLSKTANGSEGSTSLNPILSIPWDDDASPIITEWHPKLQQIFVGCSDGGTVIFYDSKLSSKGALMPASKGSRGVDVVAELLRSKAVPGSSLVNGEIITPFSQSANHGKKRKNEDTNETREPERPATGKHKTGGQTGGNVNFAQFVADKRVAKSKVVAGKDPREALFKYDEGGETIRDSASKGNVRILAEKTAEQEEEELKSRKA